MYSQTQYFVWATWEVTQTQLGCLKLMVFAQQLPQGIESHRRYADGVRVENLPRIHDVGHPGRDSKIDERFSVWTWALQRQNHLHVNVRWYYVGRKEQYRRMCSERYRSFEVCEQVSLRSLVILGPGSEKIWYKTGSDKSNGNWDRTARMMILQFTSESGHTVFRASSAFKEES